MHPAQDSAPADPDLSPVEEARLRCLEQGMFRVMKSLAARATRDVAGGRIDRAGYHSMVRLEVESLRLTDLADMLELDPSTVSRQVRGLEDLGLVAREPDPTDRRASIVSLTEQGRHELDVVRQRRWATLTAALEGLSEDERDQLARLVAHLADNIVDPDGRGTPSVRPHHLSAHTLHRPPRA